MIKLNDYADISFFKWLARNIEKNNYSLENLFFEQLVEDYLLHNCSNWNLKLFLKLFQDYLLRYQPTNGDINQAFIEFCNSTKSLEYIDPESVNKLPYLQPYLYRFYCFASKIYFEDMDINGEFVKVAYGSLKNREGLYCWFENLINEYGHLLKDCFSRFNNHSSYYDLYYQFINWLRIRKSNIKEMPIDIRDTKYDFDYNSRKHRLLENINNKSQEEIMRLLIHNNTNSIGKGILSNEDIVYFDFLHYLSNKKGISLTKSLTLPILLEFVDLYCNEFQINKQASLKRFAKSLNKKDGLFKSIFLLLNKGEKFSIGRVNIPKLHGIILFPKNENLGDFLKSYWEDIHHMTGNSMDIYYTEEDFKNNRSCFEKIKDLPYIANNKGLYPALLVWHKFGDLVENIELVGLSHKEIFNVLQYIVITIENKQNFDSIIELTRKRIKEMLENKRNVTIDARGSQIAALGPNAKSYDTIFNMNTERGIDNE